ncbi:hypothetical protein IV203_034092 [Nitzschia inconspicua]|uniref:Uncharacterized protein n=1 Tax=Nitzschia inconspicua TaxID=303405 RepID=A0A9K3M445_9STRA|nr:hypothetical protein IV203_034092 [Nitzschia inconspicua]
MESKIVQLQIVTDQAKQEMEQKAREVKDSQERLDVAKELLRSLDLEDQERISINDTHYPELLGMHQMAKDAYETAQKRYETNQRYLDKMSLTTAASSK